MDSFAESFRTMLIGFMPFVIAIVFHEYAHGYIAQKWGDNTARDAGRLTLNPIAHVDPIGTVVLPMLFMIMQVPLLFGWAKPVPINPSRFRKFRPGLFWVSLAGPGMNFLLAIISAAAWCLVVKYLPRDFSLYEPFEIMTVISVQVNFSLGIFNLLPLPPLDGSKIVESFLSYNAMQSYERFAQYGNFILIALIFSGALRILGAPIHFFSQLTMGVMATLFGVPL